MENQEQAKPVRGQNLLEWYEALISAALVLVLIFSFFFRIIFRLFHKFPLSYTISAIYGNLCELTIKSVCEQPIDFFLRRLAAQFPL